MIWRSTQTRLRISNRIALTSYGRAAGAVSDLSYLRDRGVQYCSGAYIDKLRKANVTISMTESGDPNENALAERIFRTLKEEFKLRGFPTFALAEAAITQVIAAYNSVRPHASLSHKTPDQAHRHLVQFVL